MGNTQKVGASGSREQKAEEKCDGCNRSIAAKDLHQFVDENGRHVEMCRACWDRLQNAAPQHYVEASFGMQYEEQEENVNGQMTTVLVDTLGGGA